MLSCRFGFGFSVIDKYTQTHMYRYKYLYLYMCVRFLVTVYWEVTTCGVSELETGVRRLAFVCSCCLFVVIHMAYVFKLCDGQRNDCGVSKLRRGVKWVYLPSGSVKKLIDDRCCVDVFLLTRGRGEESCIYCVRRKKWALGPHPYGNLFWAEIRIS